MIKAPKDVLILREELEANDSQGGGLV